MKKVILLFLSLPLFGSTQTYNLTQINNGPIFSRGPVGFSIGQNAYVGMGDQSGPQINERNFYRYDKNSDTWTMPSVVAIFPDNGYLYSTAFTVNGLGFVIGGYTMTSSPAVYMNKLWAYDEGSNTWSAKAQFPGPARAFATSFVVAGMAYYGLGFSGSTYLNDLWSYDPNNDSWTQVASLPASGRIGANAFTIGNKGYVVGGTGASITSVEMWEYDPSLDSWSNLPGPGVMSEAPTRDMGVAFTLQGYGYWGFGSAPGSVTGGINDLHEYDAGQGTWKQIYGYSPSFYTSSTTRMHSGAWFTINDIAYFGLGFRTNNNSAVPDMDKFWVENVGVGIPKEKAGRKYSMFPNPTEGNVTVHSSSEIVSYAISDLSGKVLKRGNFNGTRSFNMDDFPAGIYFVTLKDVDQHLEVKKISLTR